MYDITVVYRLLNAAISSAGSQKAFADKYGVSLGYLNDVINARCDPGEKILKTLGLKKVTRYVFDNKKAGEA